MKKKLTAADKRLLAEENKKLINLFLKRQRPCIIGLDVSTVSMGAFLIREDKGFLISSKDSNIRVRINTISQMLKYILDNFPRPNVAVVEDYALHGASVAQCAECGGVVKNILFDYKIPTFFVAPTQLKKFVLGPGGSKKAKGSQSKSLMLLETFDRWGYKFSDDNVCDAFCLGKFIQELFNYTTSRGNDRQPKWLCAHFDNFLALRGGALNGGENFGGNNKKESTEKDGWQEVYQLGGFSKRERV